MSSFSNVILVGFSGTGKTLVGRKVARVLDWAFVDSDTEIEGRTGKPVRQIFAEDGESAFRAIEKQVIGEICLGVHRVVSTGGGAVLDRDNMDLMKSSGLVVRLEARPETIYARLKDGQGASPRGRPLLASDDPLKRIRSLKSEREAHYSDAHCTVKTDDLTTSQVAEIVVRYLKENVKTSCGDTGNT